MYPDPDRIHRRQVDLQACVGWTEEDAERIRGIHPLLLFSTKARGLGLGLALVRMILDRNGAALSIASEPGQGSTFAIRLALAPRGEWLGPVVSRLLSQGVGAVHDKPFDIPRLLHDLDLLAASGGGE